MGRNGNHERHGITGRSQDSHVSYDSHPLLFPRGDYRTLHSYRKSALIYDFTYRFCRRFLAKGDRTIDQMVQAARSGKQNLVEGSKAAATSREMEIKLTNVARASLAELLEDFKDFLAVRDLREWSKDEPEAHRIRRLGAQDPLPAETFKKIVESGSAGVVANTAICLIHQANFLIDRQVQRLVREFLENGGLRERMTMARLEARRRKRGWEEGES